MAQSITVTLQRNVLLTGEGDAAKIIVDWTSASDGTVALPICHTYRNASVAADVFPSKIRGYITAIETAPGASGDLATSLPTDKYDLTLVDDHGYDAAGGALANRSGTVAEKVVPSSLIPVESDLTVTIANAGDTLKGRIIVWIDPFEE